MIGGVSGTVGVDNTGNWTGDTTGDNWMIGGVSGRVGVEYTGNWTGDTNGDKTGDNWMIGGVSGRVGVEYTGNWAGETTGDWTGRIGVTKAEGGGDAGFLLRRLGGGISVTGGGGSHITGISANIVGGERI